MVWQSAGCTASPSCSHQEFAESEFHEALESAAIAFDACAQQGAFVSVEQKGGEFGRGEGFGHSALFLRFGDGGLYVLGPAFVEAAQAVADDFTLIGKFGAEVAENAPALEPGVGAHRAQPLVMSAQPLDRRNRLVRQKLAAAHVGAVAVDNLGAERLLALEVVVERSLRSARPIGDV